MTSSVNRVVLLGTGAGITPKIARNPTAAALRCGADTYVIDCGNGVGPQMLRAGVALASVRAIFITHHHLDHVADFGVLIAQCWAQLRNPVTLLGPPPIARMFELFQEMYALDLNARVVEEERQPLRELVKVSELTGAGTCYDTDTLHVSAIRVPHGSIQDAYAYRFDSADFSVVFSGDTTYSPTLAKFSEGADTLIHEATFPDALTADTLPGHDVGRLVKRLAQAHTTVYDAAKIANIAKVRRLVLTPLSPSIGVNDFEWLAAARREFSGEIIVGRDLLNVDL